MIDCTRFTITLANQGGKSFTVDADQPLLEALEAHGVSLPYGCRYGGCISCAANPNRCQRQPPSRKKTARRRPRVLPRPC